MFCRKTNELLWVEYKKRIVLLFVMYQPYFGWAVACRNAVCRNGARRLVMSWLVDRGGALDSTQNTANIQSFFEKICTFLGILMAN
jgi:hypothetical protein